MQFHWTWVNFLSIIGRFCPCTSFLQYMVYWIWKMKPNACDVITRSEKVSHVIALQWRHNGCNSVSNHQSHHCLLNRLFRRRSKKTSKLRVTGLCAGNSPGTVEVPAQMASYAENVSIWWRHHGNGHCQYCCNTIQSVPRTKYLRVLLPSTSFSDWCRARAMRSVDTIE